MTECNTNQYDPIILKLNEHYVSFSREIGIYLNSFTEEKLLSFSFSKEEIKKILKSHYIFAASAADFLDKTDALVAALTKFLYTAYDEKNETLVAKIGEIVSKQFDSKEMISVFIEECEKEIKSGEQNISVLSLYKKAAILKQKLDTLLLR